MATLQEADIFDFGSPDVAYGNDIFVNSHDHQPYAPNAFMPINRIRSFEEMSHDDPCVVSALTNVTQWQEMQQASHGCLPFRPLLPGPLDASNDTSNSVNFRSGNVSLGGKFDNTASSYAGTLGESYDSVNSSFTDNDSVQPLRIDTSVAALTPSLSILSTPVDTTQYEIVHDEEWVWSSTDYASSSHSSMRTDSTGPRTPLSPHHAGSSSQSSYFSTGYPGSPSCDGNFKVEGSGADMFPSTIPRSYLPNCPCPDCSVPVAMHQLSGSWYSNQSETSYLGPIPTYNSGMPAVAGTGLTIDFDNQSRGASRAFVPSQDSPLNTTRSLVDVERQSSETTTEHSEDSESDTEEPNVNDQAINDATHRQKRDSFLLSMRRQNYSYKDIKELGNFREAESTLRGRVRVLTKDKSERVRKPEWNRNDVSCPYWLSLMLQLTDNLLLL